MEGDLEGRFRLLFNVVQCTGVQLAAGEVEAKVGHRLVVGDQHGEGLLVVLVLIGGQGR